MKITGTATVAGIGALSLTWTALTSAYGALIPEQVTMDHKWTEDTVRDPTSLEPLTYVITDEVKSIIVEAVPAGTSGHNTKAVAAAACIYPEPNSVVTITGASVAALNATWLYKGGQWTFGTAGKAKIRMTLERRLGLDDAAHTALGTQVT